MNKNLKLREYGGEKNLHIDGRYIPYQLVNANDYLLAVNEDLSCDEVADIIDKKPEIYELITQIMALKQACVLLRHTSHSCGSLSDALFNLKLRLIGELKEQHNYLFNENIVEKYPPSL